MLAEHGGFRGEMIWNTGTDPWTLPLDACCDAAWHWVQVKVHASIDRGEGKRAKSEKQIRAEANAKLRQIETDLWNLPATSRKQAAQTQSTQKQQPAYAPVQQALAQLTGGGGR